MSTPEQLYLGLMKQCLANTIYGRYEMAPVKTNTRWKKLLLSLIRRKGYDLVKAGTFDPRSRLVGADIPPFAHTMIGIKRLENVQSCIEQVLEDRVPGDLIETGVWRGGTTIFMRAVLKAYGVTTRLVWVADSFQGLPGFPEWTVVAVPLEEVRSNFATYGLLDSQVRFLPGWFNDTLPTAPIERLAVLRLDGDLYESTMDALDNLYPRLSPGGFCIIDDYGLEDCRRAVQDYRAAAGIHEPILSIDMCGVYWRKDGAD